MGYFFLFLMVLVMATCEEKAEKERTIVKCLEVAEKTKSDVAPCMER